MANEIFVASLSFKLIHEKSDPIKAAVNFAVQSDNSVSGNILAAQIMGIDKKGKRMINLATEGDFYAGLPDLEIGYHEEVIMYPQIINPPDITVYPIIVIRENQVFIGGNDLENPVEDEKYLQTKRMMKKLNIKLIDFYEGIVGPPDNPNPDLEDLDDTFFSFSADIYSSLESTAEYFWNFFSWLESVTNIPPPFDNEFDPIITYSGYIEFAEYQGTENIVYIRISYSEAITSSETGTLVNADGKPINYLKELDFTTNTVTVKKQTAHNVIDIVTFVGLIHRVTIDAKGVIKAVYTGIKEEFIDLPPEDDAAGTGAFYFPMIMEIVELSTNRHRQIMLFDGCILILFAAQSVKLAWYQTFWFKILMTIVTIVLHFVPIFGTPIAITMQNIILVLFKVLVLGFILAGMLEAASDSLGAVIATVLIILIAIKGGSVFTGMQTMPFATKLLHATSAISKIILREDANNLQSDIDRFDESIKEEQERLREKQESLEGGSLDPLLLVATNSTDYYESPDNFYTRCIHTCNPGVLSLDAVMEFVNNALLLPELPELKENELPNQNTEDYRYV